MDLERQPLLTNKNRATSIKSCDNTEDENSSLLSNHANYDPHSHRQVSHPTSNFDTMIHLLKGNIGTGILALPEAFRCAGLYFGLFGLMFIGIIATHCMHMILVCTNELCRRRRVPSMDYSETCYSAFSTGSPRYRKYAPLAKNIINAFLFFSQIGFCCVYFVVVAENLKIVGDHYLGEYKNQIYLLVLLIPMIMLNFLKNLKMLAPVSLFASILTILGLIFVFFYILNGIPSTKNVPKFAGISELPKFFGIVIFAFEGIGIVLPLENNMKTPQAFGGITGVLNTGMVIIAVLYSALGFFGYLKFGDEIQASITFNLESKPVLANSVRVLFAIATFLSYSLQFYIPMQIIGPWFHKHFSEHSKHLYDGILRVSLVVITCILAAVVPDLSAIISLFGAVFSSSLALIFPPIVEILTFGLTGMGPFYWKLWKNVAIILFGVCGFVLGGYVSISKLINAKQK